MITVDGRRPTPYRLLITGRTHETEVGGYNGIVHMPFYSDSGRISSIHVPATDYFKAMIAKRTRRPLLFGKRIGRVAAFWFSVRKCL